MCADESEDESTVNIDVSELKDTFDEDASRAYLVVLSGPRAGEMFELEDGGLILGRDRESVDIWFGNPSVSRHHARVAPGGEGEVTVTDLDSSNGTFINGDQIAGEKRLEEGDKLRLGTKTILKFSYQDELETHFQKELYESSIRDELTGAYTKAYLLDQLRSEMSFASRADRNLGLILFDLDHFKQINDTHGHVVGDKILAELATVCRAEIRDEDLFARYGGEEFAVLAREIGAENLQITAERLRSTIDEHDFVIDGRSHDVTVSLGLSTLGRTEASTPTEFISTADEALYEAKEAGRNCWRVFASDAFDPRETQMYPGAEGDRES